MIHTKGLCKKYGDSTALYGLDIDVKKGEFFGFLGVNGAGKSTTINMLTTALSPTSGLAEVCGYALDKAQDIRRRIGVVYQGNCLDAMLTVRENLISRAYLYNTDKKAVRQKLSEISGLLNMEEYIDKQYRMLSGGMKRRCEIAAALMHSPELLFLDEPTTGLDPATRADVWETIDKLRKSTDMTVFLTTHYMEEAAKADRIVIIDKGRKIAEGTPFELKEQYAQDMLILYPKNSCDIGRDENGTADRNSVRIAVKGTLSALPIIEKYKDSITGFEVIGATLDDVFLKAVEGNK